MFNRLSSKPLRKATKVMENADDYYSYHTAFMMAGSIIDWYKCNGFWHCSVKELDDVIYYCCLRKISEECLRVWNIKAE